MKSVQFIFLFGLIKCENKCVLTEDCDYHASNGSLSESAIYGIIKHLLLDYDKRKRAQIDKVLDVSVNFFVETLSAINEASMDYEITVFFRQVL